MTPAVIAAVVCKTNPPSAGTQATQVTLGWDTHWANDASDTSLGHSAEVFGIKIASAVLVLPGGPLFVPYASNLRKGRR